MIFNIGVVAFSFLLLLYWFRYTCVLMLRTKPVRDYSKQVAAANRLNVFEVRSRLTAAAGGGNIQGLDELQSMLDRDYRLLMFLMGHAASFKTAGYEMEQTMLKLNYHIVKRAYALSKRFSIAQGSERLSEMAAIIAHFANLMGERAESAAAQ
ncbi:MAG: hypothetical protein ACR2NN_19590 [Bryobacteraceae bacterium]